jgi:adenosylcobinamide kinase/adenosylcobinamide-phosphate guanylyltransferase
MTAVAPKVARTELILGGQKSGKSRRARAAQSWLKASRTHHAVLLATAWPVMM